MNLPQNKTSLEAIILKAHKGITQASADAKNCAEEWREQFGPDHPALGYLEGKRAGLEESRLILELEISNAK